MYNCIKYVFKCQFNFGSSGMWLKSYCTQKEIITKHHMSEKAVAVKMKEYTVDG